MKKIFHLILIIISVAAIQSCKEPIPEGPGVLASSEVDVYVAGSEDGVAKYWKNGVAVNLTDGRNWMRTADIAVSGSNVYVAGFECTEINGEIYLDRAKRAMYWKNGQAVALTDGTKEAAATSIAVVGSDVYVAGYDGLVFSPDVAKYWKNGVAVNLTDGTKKAAAFSIAVVGSDVYVAGFENNGSFWVAKYWKNGQAIALTDGTKDAHATSIAVVGTDVYVAGHELDVAKYWKNGQATTLGTNGAGTYDIAVVGSDVYVAGYDQSGSWNNDQMGSTWRNLVAKYWKNGQAIALTDGTREAMARSIAVVNGNVYVAGYEFHGRVIIAGEYEGPYVAKYWKNGQAKSLSDSTTAEASSIVVVKR